MMRAMKHFSYGERLREFVLFILEKRKLWGYLIVAFQYMKRPYEKDGERFLTRVSASEVSKILREKKNFSLEKIYPESASMWFIV
ncbi:hypothetical protein DUI87_09160 [Hirundo rustica rustica]|uniref:Uncharacterized protein n=1 Tax=Hirundo rustica rustica TaxID=333673 RepID=A0A3M0KLE8_HIRRU|nr:hypothetical protein DUI87_09160 [Hirundo rustica rustica]